MREKEMNWNICPLCGDITGKEGKKKIRFSNYRLVVFNTEKGKEWVYLCRKHKKITLKEAQQVYDYYKEYLKQKTTTVLGVDLTKELK